MSAPAAPGSALGGLRARRKQAVEKLFIDMQVPRYDPPIFVRYGPIDQAEQMRITDRIANSKSPDRLVRANAAILATAVIGVFEEIDGEKVSVDENDRGGDWPKFDEHLAEILGEDVKGAADVARALYLTDGDLIATAEALARWSGFKQREIEEMTSGN